MKIQFWFSVESLLDHGGEIEGKAFQGPLLDVLTFPLTRAGSSAGSNKTHSYIGFAFPHENSHGVYRLKKNSACIVCTQIYLGEKKNYPGPTGHFYSLNRTCMGPPFFSSFFSLGSLSGNLPWRKKKKTARPPKKSFSVDAKQNLFWKIVAIF